MKKEYLIGVQTYYVSPYEKVLQNTKSKWQFANIFVCKMKIIDLSMQILSVKMLLPSHPFSKTFQEISIMKKLLFYLTFTELFNHFYGNNQVLKKLCLIELTRTRKIRWVLAIFQTRTQKTPDPLRWPKPELKKNRKLKLNERWSKLSLKPVNSIQRVMSQFSFTRKTRTQNILEFWNPKNSNPNPRGN